MHRILRYALLAAIPAVIFLLQLQIEDGRIWAVIVGAVIVPALVQLFLILRQRKGLSDWYREHFPPRENPARILLEKVRASWVGEYLDKTIAGSDLAIEFDFQPLDGSPSEDGRKRRRRPSLAHPGPAGERHVLGELLARSGHRLLITGMPGGGKTVMMLKVTALLADAAHDRLHCIPLVLNLSPGIWWVTRSGRARLLGRGLSASCG